MGGVQLKGMKRGESSTSSTTDSTPHLPTLEHGWSLSSSASSNGFVQKETTPKGTVKKKKVTIEDFEPIKSLGEGAYGEVMLVALKSNKKRYAMKVLDKHHISKQKKEHQVLIEKQALSKLSHPNFVKLHYSFQDESNLYMVIDYITNGDVSRMLKLMKKLEPETVRFYAAEMVEMLAYLKGLNIAHRDLKPDNILVDDNYHLKLTDFGTAKFTDQGPRKLTDSELQIQQKSEEFFDDIMQEHRGTFVGTKDYVSPEVLKDFPSNFEADLWALGCIIYQLYTGEVIFKAHTEFLTFQLILNRDIKYPKEMDQKLKDLIDKLVQLEPDERLGSGGKAGDIQDLKQHPYFEGINFSKLAETKVPMSQSFKKLLKEREQEEEKEMKQSSSFGGSFYMSESQQQEKEQIDPNSIIKQGIVIKKCGWFLWRKRLLRLTEKPSITYYDPVKNQFKNEIPLTPEVHAKKVAKNRFDIVTPHRTWYFKQFDPIEMAEWISTINETIKKKL